MDTYVFANQKGGVGKTTIALGIAAALARARHARLLIDLDPQASATKVLGVDVTERCTIADALLEPERFPLGETIVRRRGGRRGAGGDGAGVARVASLDCGRVRSSQPARRVTDTTRCSSTSAEPRAC